MDGPAAPCGGEFAVGVVGINGSLRATAHLDCLVSRYSNASNITPQGAAAASPLRGLLKTDTNTVTACASLNKTENFGSIEIAPTTL